MATRIVELNSGDEPGLLDVCKNYIQAKTHDADIKLSTQTWALQSAKKRLATGNHAVTNTESILQGLIERTESEVVVATQKYSELTSIREAFTQGLYEPLITCLEESVGLSLKTTTETLDEVQYPTLKMLCELRVVWRHQQMQQQ